MKKQIYYFKDDDSDEMSHSIEYLLEEAVEDGLKTILLYEAIPDNSEPDYVWCSEKEATTEKSECKKSQCCYYKPRNGKNGVCEFRRRLYTSGTPHLFEVKTGKELPLPEDYDTCS